MSGWTLAIVWVVCVLLGAAAGYLLGYLLWQLGLELIGSAVALVGAGVGGLAAFLGFMNWQENRQP